MPQKNRNANVRRTKRHVNLGGGHSVNVGAGINKGYDNQIMTSQSVEYAYHPNDASRIFLNGNASQCGGHTAWGISAGFGVNF